MTESKNKQYDAYSEHYNEAEALQQLLRATDYAIAIENERFERTGEIPTEQFTITIAGIQTAFYVGGPQADALFDFIKRIAAENLYSVDFDKKTVTGW